MTRFARLLTIGLSLPLLGIGCSSPTEPRERLVAIDVGPSPVVCLVGSVGGGGGYGYAYACMNVRELPDGDWVTRYSDIEGFEFKPGLRSRLLVYRPSQLPMDASEPVYRLWKVVERVPVSED